MIKDEKGSKICFNLPQDYKSSGAGYAECCLLKRSLWIKFCNFLLVIVYLNYEYGRIEIEFAWIDRGNYRQ